ncbi:hypothetical protein FDO65_12645 [Nakamurella flava]|uniref:DUF2231 domain-containing protein n=1 Tax=Nakamurella flava TaxID=2576308 RepID=A0A4U6QE59_9ACTN|nr:DUF2231 domain-containing protein [Nakamurella flava]TKV58413.1 hypothetical protein FDO65_12645 [Nakamurella flava]
MFDTFFGLPLHPLVVHATVVAVPATAAALLLTALWPRFRRWAGWGPLALAVGTLGLVPLSTESGEKLEKRLGHSDLIRQHAEYADGLLPWAAGAVLVALGLWWWRQSERPEPGRFGPLPCWAPVILRVAAVVVAAGITVQVILIGHSGAEAAWNGVVSA